MEGRRRWIALGALVLCMLSFQPWYAVRSAHDVEGFWVKTVMGRNAWQASPIWAAGVAAGLVAVLVWFGALKRLDRRRQRLVAAVLLLAAVALAGQEYRPYPRKGQTTYQSRLYLGDGHGNIISSTGNPISLRDHFSAGVEPAQRMSVAVLVLMLGLVVVAPAAELRPGGGRRRGEA